MKFVAEAMTVIRHEIRLCCILIPNGKARGSSDSNRSVHVRGVLEEVTVIHSIEMKSDKSIRGRCSRARGSEASVLIRLPSLGKK